MKVLHLDENHPKLYQGFKQLGISNYFDFESEKKIIEKTISRYDGIVLRSRIGIDKYLIEKASKLKFIVRVGSGLENIDVDYAKKKEIKIISSPEGNSNAVGEHALGMLLSLINYMYSSQKEIFDGFWHRESNRGFELKNKTVGIIGYGNTGKSFSKKLSGMDVKVIFNDLKLNLSDQYAQQVSLSTIQEESDVISIHTSLNSKSTNLINKNFINKCKKPFWLINTSRGQCLVLEDLIEGLKKGKILGAALDVIEYEKKTFENLLSSKKIMTNFLNLVDLKKIVITPHIAGWTHESKIKMVEVILKKVEKLLK
tara:strand:+ start:364 stop:1302 length:939 start_codon:yes stop_codon:yes gene_type:complete